MMILWWLSGEEEDGTHLDTLRTIHRRLRLGQRNRFSQRW